jgi:hypothetical protein
MTQPTRSDRATNGGTEYVQPIATAHPGAQAGHSAGKRLVKLGVALAVGLALGWGVQQGVQWWRGQSNTDVQPRPTINLSHLSNNQGSGTRPATTVAANVQTWLLLGNQKHSLNRGQVALPSGSRFQIQISSSVAGQLTLKAVNPAGQPVGGAIWSGLVAQGGEVTTPVLRLEGTKGRESLHITLQPNSGQAPQTQVVHLWHL